MEELINSQQDMSSKLAKVLGELDALVFSRNPIKIEIVPKKEKKRITCFVTEFKIFSWWIRPAHYRIYARSLNEKITEMTKQFKETAPDDKISLLKEAVLIGIAAHEVRHRFHWERATIFEKIWPRVSAKSEKEAGIIEGAVMLSFI